MNEYRNAITQKSYQLNNFFTWLVDESVLVLVASNILAPETMKFRISVRVGHLGMFGRF